MPRVKKGKKETTLEISNLNIGLHEIHSGFRPISSDTLSKVRKWRDDKPVQTNT